MKQKLILIVAVITLAQCGVPGASGQWVQVGLANHRIFSFTVSNTNLFAGSDSGVFLSTDSGASWSAESNGLPFGIYPYDSGLCLVQSITAKGDNLFAGMGSGGVFCSTDNGISWKAASNGMSTNNSLNNITAFAVSDTNIFAATGAGVFLSSNYGSSWIPVDNGFPTNEFVYTLVVDGTHLIAGTGARDTGSVFISADNGGTWMWASYGLPNSFGVVNALYVGQNYVFAGIGNSELNMGEVYFSTDKGAYWIEAGHNFPGNSGPVSSLVLSDSDLFTGIFGGGVYWLADTGNSWIAINSGLTDTNVYALLVAGAYLFAGTDSGVWRIPLSDFGISSVSNVTPPENSLESFPNPFTQSTTITFSSPESGVAEVTIVNLLGTQVARLFEGELSAGEHSFTWNAAGFVPGTYWAIVRMNGRVVQVPIVLE